MKKIFILLYFFPLIINAQLYYVSNNPAVKTDFATLQGAIDSVPAGSCLYLLPGTGNYGDVVLNKKITLFGTGILLNNNLEPFTQVNEEGCRLNSIHFKPGSSGSRVEGVTFRTLNSETQTVYKHIWLDSVTDITVTRCSYKQKGYTSGDIIVYLNATNNCRVSQCYFDLLGEDTYTSYVINDQAFFSSNPYPYTTGFSFNNNIVFGPSAFTPMGFSISSYTEAVFYNNTLYGQVQPVTYFDYVKLVNNIFINPAGAAISIHDRTRVMRNNIFCNGSGFFPVSFLGYNRENENADSIFVYSTFGYHSFDEKWKIRPGNFAATYGTGGTECGAFGGTEPYHLSGLSRIPYIYRLTSTKDSAIQGNMKLHIKAMAVN